MNLHAIGCAALIASALLLPHASFAQPKPIELRYTTGAPPKGNPWVMQIERLVKEIDDETKGEVKIQPYFASQLGNEMQMLDGRGGEGGGGMRGGYESEDRAPRGGGNAPAPRQSRPQQAPAPQPSHDDFDDDIPF